MTKILQQTGYSVIEAKDGEEALQLFKGHEKEIDLLLTDVVMPRMSGDELAETMTRRMPSIKVILLSGYARDAILPGKALGEKWVFLQKPVSVVDLQQRVQTVLENG